MVSPPCGRKTWRPWFLITIFLLDFSCPVPPQDDVISRLYSADLIPTTTFLCAPIPPRLPASVNTHGVNVGFAITLLITLLTMSVDPSCDFEHRKFRQCKVLLTENSGCFFYCYCRQPLKPRYQILVLMFAVGVVEMLLLMAGDVERNPGPVVTELEPSDLVTVLAELMEATAEWENVGLALGLLSGTLDGIKGPHKPPKDCLRDMLKAWLNTSSPCWERVIESLRSTIVGMESLANKLERKYCSQQASNPLPEPSNVRASRKRNLETEDGNERQKPKLDPQPAMQASAEMQSESSDISNIRKRTLETEGESGLWKQTRSAVLVTQEPGIAAVSTATSTLGEDSIDTYSSYLKSYYLRKNLPVYGKLPVSPSRKYTHLASVLKEPVTKQQADEFTKKTIHGNIDDIAKKKVSITMEEIAVVKHGVWPQLILVEGAPGIGKTTFAWEMCRQWSKGEILENYKLVVTLRLREKKVREVKCVSDLFYFHDTDVQHDVVQRIAKTGGRGVLLLFEGYDELPADLRTEDSFFMDVIKGNELPEATVLITSRPSASGFLYETCKDCIDQHVEILGFTSADIQTYLKDTCGQNESLLSGIQKYLQCYPHIRTMMYVPLNAGIIIEVYRTSKENNSVIPKTKTQLYQSLVCSLLRRYLRAHPIHGKKKWSICSFEDLPEDVYQQLCVVARIAEEGLRNNQQVIFSDLPEEFDTLGLMQCVPELYVDRGAVVSHSFPHLTIQEFMAAYHISQSPVEAWVEGSRTQNDNEGMVKHFVAGLTKLNGITIRHEGCRHTSAYLFHLIFEAQIDYPSIECGSISIDFSSSSSSFDWYVLGYCIARSDKVWSIAANDRLVGDDAVEGLVQGVLEYDGNYSCGISVLFLHSCSITSEGFGHLLKLPKHILHTLVDLSLKYNTKIGNGVCAPLVEMLPKTLVHLILCNTGIGGLKDYKSLNKLLMSSTALESLDIRYNYFSPEGVQLIFSGVQASTGLKGLILSMSCSGFSSQNCKTLASLLQNNNGTLSELNLDCNSSTYDEEAQNGTEKINLKFLKWSSSAICGTLCTYQSETGHFSHCQDSGLVFALGYCVSHTKYTWEIEFTNSLTDDVHIESFVHGVLECSTLPQSTISILKATLDYDSKSISHLLQVPKDILVSLKILSLERTENLPTTSVDLDLSNVGITVDDCKALNKLLASSSTLETLDITANYLRPECVELIFSGLQASTNLKGLKLAMRCLYFSSQNCKTLASLIQNNNGTLLELKLKSLITNRNEEQAFTGELDEQALELQLSQEPFTAICFPLTRHQADRTYNVTTLYTVLGYCVSHSIYTWNIELCCRYHEHPNVEDSEVKEFVQGLLDCEAQPQSTISSLTIDRGGITYESIQKIPKCMFFSLKKLVVGSSPRIFNEVDLINVNTLSGLLPTLETVEISVNSIPFEDVAVILSDLQKVKRVRLSMTYSQFSVENCQLLASVLQNSTSTLRIDIWLSWGDLHCISLRVLPGPLTAIHGSWMKVIMMGFGKRKAVPQPCCVTPGYILGYCVSHTSHTWAIDLDSVDVTEIETIMQGILECEPQSQCRSNITSLCLNKLYVKLTRMGVNEFLRLPKHMLSSMKFSAVVGQSAGLIQQFQDTFVELHLGGSEIDTNDCQTLSKLLLSSSTLEILDINASLSPEAVELILSGLHKNTGLKTLSFHCSQLTLENCKSLVLVIDNNNGEGTLRALQVVLGDLRMELQFLPGPVTGSVRNTGSPWPENMNIPLYALGYCISHSACTWEIILSGVPDDPHRGEDGGMKAFVHGILSSEFEPQSIITSLSVIGTHGLFKGTITSTDIKWLLQLPKHMLCSLKTLSLKDNPKIGNGGCVPLVKMLPTTLVDLSLFSTGIGVDDCKSLNKLLRLSSALETLDISENYLSPEAVEMTFSGIQRTTGLTTLKMDYSQVSPKVCGLLASFLRNQSLTLLSVSNCNIGMMETEQLVDALTCKDTLQRFSLANNPIGDDGVEHLCKYLCHTKSLRTLDMSGCSITLKGAEALMSILQRQQKTTLEALILPDRFSGWIPESLRSRVTTRHIEDQKSRHRSEWDDD